MATRVSVVKLHLDPARAFVTSRTLEAHLTQSQAWGRNAQDFRGSVQRDHLVSESHLWVKPELVGIRGEQSHSGFLGSNSQLLSLCPPHRRLWSRDSKGALLDDLLKHDPYSFRNAYWDSYSYSKLKNSTFGYSALICFVWLRC